jgi:hypothetical protein
VSLRSLNVLGIDIVSGQYLKQNVSSVHLWELNHKEILNRQYVAEIVLEMQVGHYSYSSDHIHSMTNLENAYQPTQFGNLSSLGPTVP